MKFLKLTAPQLHDLIELCEEGQRNRESDADDGVEDAQAAYDTSVEVLERLYSLRDTAPATAAGEYVKSLSTERCYELLEDYHGGTPPEFENDGAMRDYLTTKIQDKAIEPSDLDERAPGRLPLLRADRRQPTPTANDVLLEFIGDVEAVGLAELETSWPDLVPTYQRALDAVYKR